MREHRVQPNGSSLPQRKAEHLGGVCPVTRVTKLCSPGHHWEQQEGLAGATQVAGTFRDSSCVP